MRIWPLVVLISGLSFAACGGSGSPTSPSSTSTSTSSGGSHNAGRDCTSCHRFTLAGTAYKADGTTVYPRAVIRLTTAVDGGTTVATLTADASGNFYTSASVAFGQGLYATATGTTGATRSMVAAVTAGSCNSCHTAGSRLIVN